MNNQPRLMTCACCGGNGGYRHATHLDPAEYCDLCYGAGKVTAQRNAAYTAHRTYRNQRIAQQIREIPRKFRFVSSGHEDALTRAERDNAKAIHTAFMLPESILF